jgi:hypothetical protein
MEFIDDQAESWKEYRVREMKERLMRKRESEWRRKDKDLYRYSSGNRAIKVKNQLSSARARSIKRMIDIRNDNL